MPCRGLGVGRLRPERYSFADTGRPPANPFKQHTLPCRSGAPFSGHLMTAIDRTAYPRPEARLTREELGERYHLSEPELAFIHASARRDTGRLLLATLLKSRRDFGYFPAPNAIHARTAEHLALQLGVTAPEATADEMRRTKSLYRYQASVRSYLCVKPCGDEAGRLVTGTVLEACRAVTNQTIGVAARCCCGRSKIRPLVRLAVLGSAGDVCRGGLRRRSTFRVCGGSQPP